MTLTSIEQHSTWAIIFAMKRRDEVAIECTIKHWTAIVPRGFPVYPRPVAVLCLHICLYREYKKVTQSTLPCNIRSSVEGPPVGPGRSEPSLHSSQLRRIHNITTTLLLTEIGNTIHSFDFTRKIRSLFRTFLSLEFSWTTISALGRLSDRYDQEGKERGVIHSSNYIHICS